jgi:outer membrane lipoprotein-sorting protein
MEMVDADGDRTTVHFEDVKLNTGLKESDLALKTPSGTKVSYPLGDHDGK